VTATETWFDAVARVAATVEGIKGAVAYAAGTGGQGSAVKPIPRSLSETPAAVLYYRGTGAIRQSNAQRIEHLVQLRIYVPRSDLGDAYGLLMRFPRRVLDALEARTKAFGNIEAVTVLSFGAVEQEEWPPTQDGTGKWYLVLPAELQAVEYKSASYQPA